MTETIGDMMGRLTNALVEVKEEEPNFTKRYIVANKRALVNLIVDVETDRCYAAIVKTQDREFTKNFLSPQQVWWLLRKLFA